jgi:hypothetical protein
MLGAAATACENKSSTLAHARTPHSKLGVSGPIFSKSTSSCGTGSPSDVNTSMAARAPACSAPLMYPGHQVAVSVPAKAMRACEALIESPHCASTPALAVPTGQPPVNGSFAQSNSRYMRACHAPARRTRAPEAPPPLLCWLQRIRAKVLGQFREDELLPLLQRQLAGGNGGAAGDEANEGGGDGSGGAGDGVVVADGERV